LSQPKTGKGKGAAKKSAPELHEKTEQASEVKTEEVAAVEPVTEATPAQKKEAPVEAPPMPFQVRGLAPAKAAGVKLKLKYRVFAKPNPETGLYDPQVAEMLVKGGLAEVDA